MKTETEQRSERAMQLFSQGYNCAQSVVAAWADHYGLTPDIALRISSSFGGGIGRMRLTCGAACGMFILAGLETGTTDPTDRDAKAANYKAVQQLAADFRQAMGSITCGELLGLSSPEGTPMPQERTPEYYRKRPCRDIVGQSSRIFGQFLEKKHRNQRQSPREDIVGDCANGAGRQKENREP